jgi:hypothetical protein
MPESWEQLKEYIRQLEDENADLQQQLAIANTWLVKYEDPYR